MKEVWVNTCSINERGLDGHLFHHSSPDPSKKYARDQALTWIDIHSDLSSAIPSILFSILGLYKQQQQQPKTIEKLLTLMNGVHHATPNLPVLPLIVHL